MSFRPSAVSVIAQAAATGDFVLAEDIGVPNGVAGLDEDGNIPATAIHLVDTAANLASVTLKNGQIALASDTNDILRGNGTTPGGVLVQGGIRVYRKGPVNLTYLPELGNLPAVNPDHTSDIAMVAGAVYRLWGTIGFLWGH